MPVNGGLLMPSESTKLIRPTGLSTVKSSARPNDRRFDTAALEKIVSTTAKDILKCVPEIVVGVAAASSGVASVPGAIYLSFTIARCTVLITTDVFTSDASDQIHEIAELFSAPGLLTGVASAVTGFSDYALENAKAANFATDVVSLDVGDLNSVFLPMDFKELEDAYKAENQRQEEKKPNPPSDLSSKPDPFKDFKPDTSWKTDNPRETRPNDLDHDHDTMIA